MHILHSIISFQNHKDNEQDDKIGNLYYNTYSDDCSHHTSESSLRKPSKLQQMARGLDKSLTT
jgi:hypothetical protein